MSCGDRISACKSMTGIVIIVNMEGVIFVDLILNASILLRSATEGFVTKRQ